MAHEERHCLSAPLHTHHPLRLQAAQAAAEREAEELREEKEKAAKQVCQGGLRPGSAVDR